MRPNRECGFNVPAEERENGSDEVGRDSETGAQGRVQRYCRCQECGWRSSHLYDERDCVLLRTFGEDPIGVVCVDTEELTMDGALNCWYIARRLAC